MSSQGPLIAGTGANDASVGTVAWSNPGNITANDGSSASYTSGTAVSNYLKGTNFGFSIPSGATIDGIEVTIERGVIAGNATDAHVRIVKGGSISATNLTTGATWNSGSMVVDTLGGPTELWGESWTSTDINASDFGFAVALSTAGASPAQVDYIAIKVYYTAAPPPAQPITQLQAFGYGGRRYGSFAGRVQQYDASTSDTISFSETYTVIHAHGRSLSDTLTLSETYVVQQGFGRSLSDTISFSETYDITGSYVKPLSDTISFSETLANTAIFDRSLSDSITLSETYTPSLAGAILPYTTDTLTFTETYILNRSSYLTISESITLVEQFARTFVITWTDSLTFTEAYNEADLVQTVTEAIAFTDEYSAAHTMSRTTTESLILVELLSRTTCIEWTDTLTLVESTVGICACGTIIMEELPLVERYGWSLATMQPIYGDNLPFIETYGYYNFAVQGSSDTCTLSETYTKTHATSPVPTDMLSFGESVSATVFRVQQLTDTIVFTESYVGNQNPAPRELPESFVLTETFDLDINAAPRYDEEFLDFEETYVCNVYRNLYLCDCIELTERLARVFDCTFSDTITFTEHNSRLALADTIVFVEAYGTNALEGNCCGIDYVNLRGIVDTIQFTETYTVGKRLTLAISDTLVISDTLMYI